jgi:hypothetical protein
MKKLMFVLLVLSYAIINAEPPKSQSEYEKYVDSLYQINIKIAMEYGKALQTNPKAVRPEPAIWFLDMNGNMYDYPPTAENDSIVREREAYKRRQDSLGGKQFIELEKWYNEKHKK